MVDLKQNVEGEANLILNNISEKPIIMQFIERRTNFCDKFLKDCMINYLPIL